MKKRIWLIAIGIVVLMLALSVLAVWLWHAPSPLIEGKTVDQWLNRFSTVTTPGATPNFQEAMRVLLQHSDKSVPVIIRKLEQRQKWTGTISAKPWYLKFWSKVPEGLRPLLPEPEQIFLAKQMFGFLVLALGAEDEKTVLPVLLKSSEDKNPIVRTYAGMALTLSGFQSPEVKKALERLQTDPDPNTRSMAQSLKNISGIPFGRGLMKQMFLSSSSSSVGLTPTTMFFPPAGGASSWMNATSRILGRLIPGTNAPSRFFLPRSLISTNTAVSTATNLFPSVRTPSFQYQLPGSNDTIQAPVVLPKDTHPPALPERIFKEQ